MRQALLVLLLAPLLALSQEPPPAPSPDDPPRDSAQAPEGSTEVPFQKPASTRNVRQRLGLPTQAPGGMPMPARPPPGVNPVSPTAPAPAAAPTGGPSTPAVRAAPAPAPGRAVTPTGAAAPPGPAAARPAPTAPPAAPPARASDAKCTPLAGKVMLNFAKTDIVDVLEQASRWTCRNFIYTDDIARGKITLLSQTPVTADEAYAAFLAALASNNIAVYPTGRYYKLVRAADSRKAPIPMLGAEDGTPGTEQPVTKILRLQYADADQLRGILGNFISPQGADIQSIPPDVLVITDLGVNLKRIEKLVQSIDRAGTGDTVRIVQIRFASAKDVADKVNQIFQSQGGAAPGRPGSRRTVISGARPAPGGQAPPAAPAAPSAAGPTEVSITKVLADERTNKLIVIADDKSFQRIQELIDQIDVPTSGEGGIHVVFLKNANAEEMAQTLSNLAQGTSGKKATGAPGAPAVGPGVITPAGMPTQARPPAQSGEVTAELFSGEVKITADKTQNALLIQAGGADFVAISRLIEKLDRPRRQVFVEAVLLEVNIRNESQFGVTAHGFVPYETKNGTGLIPIASEPSSRFNSFSIASVASLGGFLTGFAGPVSAEVKALGLNLPSIGVLVQALQTNADVNVISTPHLVATDNEESEIAVGNNVPFQAGLVPAGLQNLINSASSSAQQATAANLIGTNSLSSNIAPIQRQNVELRLKIKPQINEGGAVRLSIDEQVEEITSTDPQLGPTTAKRSVKTQIVAKDQSTIVIGGLIQERSIRSVSKLPVLGSIPIIGWLFRDTVTSRQKTNLLLFLTPYIIRGEADYRRIYELKRKEQEQFVEQFYGRQPGFEVDVDWSKKAGPYARLRSAVAEEQAKPENGGSGRPGEGTIRAPGPTEPIPGSRPTPPAPPAEATPPEPAPAAPQPVPEGSAPPAQPEAPRQEGAPPPGD